MANQYFIKVKFIQRTQMVVVDMECKAVVGRGFAKAVACAEDRQECCQMVVAVQTSMGYCVTKTPSDQK
jgi:hypothetical protein